MTLNYQKDPAAQVPTLAASSDGVDSAIRYYEKGTDEVKHLLKNECSIIYECSFCRSLFRSIINFVAHKRTICRSLQTSVRAEKLELIREQSGAKTLQEKGDSTATTTTTTNPVQPKRGPYRSTRGATLKRFNPASNLAKQIRPVTVRLERTNQSIEIPTLPKITRPTAETLIVNGQQVVQKLPADLSIKDRVPDDRVALVMPRESSVRYGEMQLRRRHSKSHISRKERNSSELTPDEIAIIERIPSGIPVDFVKLRCEDQRCLNGGQQSFSFLAALAHHLAIQHQIYYTEGGLLKGSAAFINCFLCDVPPFKRVKDLQKHFIAVHSTIRDQHIASRIEHSGIDQDGERRCRSLSPLSQKHQPEPEQTSETKDGDKKDCDEEEERKRKQTIKKEEEEDEGGEEADFGKQQLIVPITMGRKRGRPNFTIRRLSDQEERTQKMAAALALKHWLQNLQLKEGIENGNGGGSEGHNQHDHCSAGAGWTTLDGNKETAQIEHLINEDEARHIDQLLNSKSSAQSSQTEDNISTAADGGTAQGLTAEEPIISKKVKRQYRVAGKKKKTDEPSEKKPEKKPKISLLTAERTPRSKRRTKKFDDIFCPPAKLKRIEKRSHSVSAEPLLHLASIKDESDINLEQPMQRIRKEPITKRAKKGRGKAKKLKLKVAGTAGVRGGRASRAKSFDKQQGTFAEVVNGATVSPRESASSPVLSLKKIGQSIEDFVLPESIRNVDASTENSVELEQPTTEEHEGGEEEHNNKIQVQQQQELDMTTPPKLIKEQLPSVVTDRNKEVFKLYTPSKRRRTMDNGSGGRSNANKQQLGEETASTLVEAGKASTSRRKQNLSEMVSATETGPKMPGTNLADNKEKPPPLQPAEQRKDGAAIVTTAGGTSRRSPPPKPKDLSQIPVYLTEAQRDLFFKPLKALFNQSVAEDGHWQCGECGEMLKCVKDGRRHMVSHIRVIRIRCSLCDCGAFFCSDMRVHLMYRHCERLNLVPDNFVASGTVVPCMDKEKADMLTKLVDIYNPGRAVFTTGKIISWSSPKGYYPDPKIERNILGPALPSFVTSGCSQSPKKFQRSALFPSLSPRKLLHPKSPKKIISAGEVASKSESSVVTGIVPSKQSHLVLISSMSPAVASSSKERANIADSTTQGAANCEPADIHCQSEKRYNDNSHRAHMPLSKAAYFMREMAKARAKKMGLDHNDSGRESSSQDLLANQSHLTTVSVDDNSFQQQPTTGSHRSSCPVWMAGDHDYQQQQQQQQQGKNHGEGIFEQQEAGGSDDGATPMPPPPQLIMAAGPTGWSQSPWPFCPL